MNIFNLFKSKGSAPVARERLQILLEYERRQDGKPDLAALLRDEILELVSRHVRIDPDRVQVKLDRRDRVSTLAVDIEIPHAANA
ncbi:cell division topological specificity factor MinE [Bradyrhizobium sp. LHD-71]|uniref:cell division topological specificity factor MinE n=1 Tax=Bradyrhizobium sp. LHD-71 TaxID=3072141 RepID=UPI00280C4F32|nr:cell division topological specificity factor MinE [Bradyrhizobium sp. LHD-71]MDQ8726339.1 cell division topological specificity factor MinE [Bradyrhizobium sp. LHD-71]